MAIGKSTPDLPGLLSRFSGALAVIRTGVKALDHERNETEILTIMVGVIQLDGVYADLDKMKEATPSIH